MKNIINKNKNYKWIIGIISGIIISATAVYGTVSYNSRPFSIKLCIRLGHS